MFTLSCSIQLAKIILAVLATIGFLIVLLFYSQLSLYFLYIISAVCMVIVVGLCIYWKRQDIHIFDQVKEQEWAVLAKNISIPHYTLIWNDEYQNTQKICWQQEEIIGIHVYHADEFLELSTLIKQHQNRIGKNYVVTVIIDIDLGYEKSFSTLTMQLQNKLRYCDYLSIPVIIRVLIPEVEKSYGVVTPLLSPDLIIQKTSYFFETSLFDNVYYQLEQSQISEAGKYLSEVLFKSHLLNDLNISMSALIFQGTEHTTAIINDGVSSIWSTICLNKSKLLFKKSSSSTKNFYNKLPLLSKILLASGIVRISSCRSLLFKGVSYIISCAFIGAFIFSASHNFILYRTISQDIVLFKEAKLSEQKSIAYQALFSHYKTLRSYQLNGLPVHLGLGFFRAESWLPEIESLLFNSQPMVVNLNSLSLFDVGKFDLKVNAQIPLIKMLKEIDKYPDMDILIEGHTDNTGSKEQNQILSEKRALAVRNWLIEFYKLPPNRFATKGYGDSCPIADNTTEEGRAQNRRVSLILIPREVLNLK